MTRIRTYLWILIFTVLALTSFISWVFAQDTLVSSSLASPSSKEKLHALSLTRFHFITLKQFHSSLFSSTVSEHSISDQEARILNTALNHFLTFSERETLLLEALRQNKSIRLKFSIQEEDPTAFEMESDSTKELLFHLEPVIKSIPTVIDIKPLLDGPVAFQVSLVKGNVRRFYEVDWSGKTNRVPGERSSAMDQQLTSLARAQRTIGKSA